MVVVVCFIPLYRIYCISHMFANLSQTCMLSFYIHTIRDIY